jgi:hypothetical protein
MFPLLWSYTFLEQMIKLEADVKEASKKVQNANGARMPAATAKSAASTQVPYLPDYPAVNFSQLSIDTLEHLPPSKFVLPRAKFVSFFLATLRGSDCQAGSHCSRKGEVE